VADKIAKFLSAEARTASTALGARRGSFPAFQHSVWPKRGYTSMRNATATCVAPTGTISVIAGTSAAIEPFFALALARRLLDDRHTIEVNPLLAADLSRLGSIGADALREIAAQGSARRVTTLPEDIRRRFPTALDITPTSHLRMQAAFQNHIDAAVSKTVNLPQDATVQTVRDVFSLAHDLRLKGITVYRYGSKPGQTLSLSDEASRSDCRDCAV
jgi:ribonucleoside-diphosphate reductase alpha chain